MLQFKATLYEMRQKFITITIADDQNKLMGSLKINLYLLATGPYHQDFSVPLPKAPGARISFNLKIAQNVKIRIRLNEVKLIPKNKEFPGDMFAFGMRSIVLAVIVRLAIRQKKTGFPISFRWSWRIRTCGVVSGDLPLIKD